MYPDTLEDVTDLSNAYGEGENNSEAIQKDKMVGNFKDCDSRVLAVMSLAEPSTVKSWQLLDMSPGPTRICGKVCSLGDALTILPHRPRRRFRH